MRSKNLMLAVFTVMNFVIAMTIFVFNGILDKVAISLNISVSNAGMLSTAYALGAAIGVPIALILFRRVERTKILKITLLITILSTLALILLNTFIGLLAARFMMGLAINTFSVLAIAIVLSVSDKAKHGRVMGILIMGNSLGLVIGVPLTRALSSSLDWRSIFGALVVIMFASLLYFFFFLPKDESKSSEIKLKTEIAFLKSGSVIAIILFALLMFIGSGAYYTYITPYLLGLFPSVEPIMTIILFLFGISSFTGNIIGGFISDRIGYKKSMQLGAIMQVVFITCILLFQCSLWACISFTMLWQMSQWFTGLQLNAGVARETENRSNLALSITTSAIQLGGAIGASLGGIIISANGVQNILFVPLFTTISITIIRFISSREFA